MIIFARFTTFCRSSGLALGGVNFLQKYAGGILWKYQLVRNACIITRLTVPQGAAFSLCIQITQ